MSDPGTNPNPENGAPAAEVARPDYLPENYWDPQAKAPKADVLKADLTELPVLREFKSQHEARLATLPKDAAGYIVELPKDFEIPKGLEFKPDENDPMVAFARGIAKDCGLDQGQFSGMVGRYAKLMLDGQAKASEDEKAFLAEQNTELGTEADKRREAVDTWGKSYFGDETWKVLSAGADYAKGIKAYEKLMQDLQGVAVRGNPQTVDATTLTPEEKKLRNMYPTMAPKAA